VNGARTSFALTAAVAAAALAIAGGPGRDGQAARAAGGVAFREIDHGTRPGTGKREELRGRVLRTESGASRVLRGWGLKDAIGAAKAVDYERRSLVVALADSRPSTGYRLRVVRVDVRHRHVIVTATVRRAEGIDGQAISRPYALVSVARRSLARATRGVVVRLQG